MISAYQKRSQRIRYLRRLYHRLQRTLFEIEAEWDTLGGDVQSLRVGITPPAQLPEGRYYCCPVCGRRLSGLFGIRVHISHMHSEFPSVPEETLIRQRREV